MVITIPSWGGRARGFLLSANSTEAGLLRWVLSFRRLFFFTSFSGVFGERGRSREGACQCSGGSFFLFFVRGVRVCVSRLCSLFQYSAWAEGNDVFAALSFLVLLFSGLLVSDVLQVFGAYVELGCLHQGQVLVVVQVRIKGVPFFC